MKKIIFSTILSLGFSAGLLASSFTVSSVNGGAATGSTKLNFDGLALGHATQAADANVTVSFSGTANVVQGAAGGLYAAPFISGSNGIGFLNPDQPTGVDTSAYLSTGIGSVTLQFDAEQDYFGLLWGSVDNYNTLSFYDGANLVGSFDGTQVWANANGDQGQQGTFYVNFNSTDGVFNRVVASSNQYAFEFDNVAYNSRARVTGSDQPQSVPDTASTLGLVGAACAGLFGLRRKLA